MTIVLVAGVTLAMVASIPSEALGIAAWPKELRAHVFYMTKGVHNPLAYGVLVTPTMMKAGGWISSPSYVGNVGWALGGADQFQYPFMSTDHGKTWRIGGTYFGGPWADACAFTQYMNAVTANVVITWGNCPNTLYVTWDRGHHWNFVPVPGNLVHIAAAQTGPSEITIDATVSTFTRPKQRPATAHYVSNDAGRIWLFTTKRAL